MLNFSKICETFAQSITPTVLNGNGQTDVETILLCTPSIAKFRPDVIYIGNADAIDQVLCAWDGRGCLNLLVCNCTDPESYKQLHLNSLNLAISSLPLADLHNQLLSFLHQYRNWETQLNSIPLQKESLGLLLKNAVSLMEQQISIYILSPTFQLLKSCVSNPMADHITPHLHTTEGCLTEKQIHFLTSCMSEEEMSVCINEPILNHNELKGYLLITANQDIHISKVFLELLLHRIIDHMASPSVYIPEESQTLITLLSDILLITPEDVKPLEQRLKKLPYPLQDNIRLLLISRQDKTEPLWNLAAELRPIFYNCNLAPYHNHIVILLSGKSFLFEPEFDSSAFEAVLTKYDAYGIISNSTRFIRGLRIVYMQSQDMLSVLPSLNITNGKRYAFFEDISEYFRVHLCVSYLDDLYGPNKFVYLLHPVVIELLRYDDAHNTDFCDFAFAYANNDCSIVRTAEFMHLHRNTVYNKLTRIKELFDTDLNDSILQREILFSGQVVKYAKIKEGNDHYSPIIYCETRYLPN